MMASLNQVNLIGNLTRDPDLKYMQSGTALCVTAIAVNKRWKDKTGTVQEKTTFVDVEFWGKTAELVNEYCEKGNLVYVGGELKQDRWEQDGAKRSKILVTGWSFQKLDRKDGEDRGSTTDGEYSEPVSKPNPGWGGSQPATQEDAPF